MTLKQDLLTLIANPSTTVEDINTWVNHNIEYIEDRILYDKQDYWATPEETLEKGAGDCEDIAILKHYILKQMSLSSKLAYCIKSDGQPHVVTVLEGMTWEHILDNETDEICSVTDRADLNIVFLFNETGIYVHGNRISGPERLPVWKELLNKL